MQTAYNTIKGFEIMRQNIQGEIRIITDNLLTY